MEFLEIMIQRPVVIATAIAGAIVATTGSFMLARPGRFKQRWSRLTLRLGYAVSGASVVLFIIAGFRAG